MTSTPRAYRKDLGFLVVPKHCRYDPSKPFHFGLLMNIAFGLGATLTVGNLYYCQPILIQLAESFGATYSDVSRIPTLVQAGYAVGLLLLAPLGDLVRRRQLILVLGMATTTLTIGLAVTSSLLVFEIVTFFIGLFSVIPQVLVPLAADASAIAVVYSGLLMGVLLARVLAGIIAEYQSWRVVYYLAIGLQGVVLLGSYLIIPDYPSKNKHLTYWQILWSMAKYSVTEPVLIPRLAIFSNFWVTLTFLLGEAPYSYSTLVIGLFGLIGMAGVVFGPFFGWVVDRCEPWYATLISIILTILFSGIQVGAGGLHISAVIIAAFGYDVARQNSQVSLSQSIFAISPDARARMNSVFILALFIGQVMGTSVGTKVFLENGWRANAGLNVAWAGIQLVILVLRGPHCGRYTWFGYEGGLAWKKERKPEAVSSPGVEKEPSTEQPTSEKQT
ncbi:membrane protein [Coprinopsis sp. MPI-PUGE-AT-0042]|nr:membrane protein [Coprinopsis sp. MPI-PUGE-AT-0042]